MKDRTYRYMNQEALYPFGFGLSYTDFEITQAGLSSETIEAGGQIAVRASIKNVGSCEGAETVQVYVHACVEGAPHYQLKALKKVVLKPGEEREVELILKDGDFGLYNKEGVKILNACEYEVFVGTSQPDARSIKLTGREPLKYVVKHSGDAIPLPE